MGDSARSTTRRHDGQTSRAKRNSAVTSTGFRRRWQGGVQAQMSGAGTNISWHGAGRTQTAASWDTRNYFRRLFARRPYDKLKAGGSFLFSRWYRGEPRDNFPSHRSPGGRKIIDEPATARGDQTWQQGKQAIQPRRMMRRPLFLPGGRYLGCLPLSCSSAVSCVLCAVCFVLSVFW